MQSYKGFIRVIAIFLALVCAFYLSFSIVTSHWENKAASYAQSMSHSNDPSNQKYKTYYSGYLDSIAKEKVYLGYYTFQQAREMEVGLGLDLKGGMNVTLQISVPDILKALSNNNPDPKFNRAIAVTDSLHHNEKDFVGAFCAEYAKIAPEGNLAQVFHNIDKIKDKPNASNAEVESILKDQVNSMVDNSYNVLRTRIDRFGVVSPNIQKLENTGRILLELPGVKEPERVRKLLQGSANLEFYETYTMQDLQQPLQALSEAIANGSKAKADTAKNAVPAAKAAPVKGAKAAPAKAKGAKTLAQMLWAASGGQMSGPVIGIVAASDTASVNRIMRSPDAIRLLPTNLKARWTVKSIDEKGHFFQLVALKTNQGRPALAGDVVTDASSDVDNLQGNVVSMTMNDEGARAWARVTQQNLNKSVAIVLDDQVYSFPTVNSVIEGGRSQITGKFSLEEAKDLANVLKSGKMVAKVNIVSESVIGPSLGQQAIQSGLWSFIIALVLLMIFMMCLYGVAPGMIVNFALFCNIFFTMGILASIQTVLTLSGIAGIVLSLGMAVDANVLIFERAKEELRAGKGIKAAMADGYKNAFSAIFDSNLTSLITAFILLYNGSGPIKGFATTLIIGLVCSFFTAVFLTRLIFENGLDHGHFKNITLTTPLTKNLWEHIHFDFIGKRKKGFMIVGVIIVLGCILLGFRGLSSGIDFSGGRNYVVQFDHPVNTVKLHDQLAPLFPGSSISVITIDNATKVRISTNYKIASNSDKTDDEIMQILYKGLKSEIGNMNFKDFGQQNEHVGVVSSEKVGPSIAEDMTRGAVWAVVFSLIAMALYILVRFRDIAFSLGALAAVAFTAFAIIIFYGLHGWFPMSMEVDQSFIAAILTIIGYQVNDTVVVFDRVRENRKLYPKQDQYTTFNHSLNSTLSRTIMTSLSTLLVLIVIIFLGGETIRSFTFAMALGVVIGTFSSIFVAAPCAYAILKRLDKKEDVKVAKLQSQQQQ